MKVFLGGTWDGMGTWGKLLRRYGGGTWTLHACPRLGSDLISSACSTVSPHQPSPLTVAHRDACSESHECTLQRAHCITITPCAAAAAGPGKACSFTH